MLLCHFQAFAQQSIYTGKIIEQNGQPVPFATISIKDTKTTTSADANGAFSINALRTDTLVFNAVNLFFNPQKHLLWKT